jgi:hypothetical protein
MIVSTHNRRDNMTYEEAMRALNDAAYTALRTAGHKTGAPVDALRKIARDIDSLIDFGVIFDEVEP